MVFDLIEDLFNINPEILTIYKRNYVLYEPLGSNNSFIVKKNSFISELATNSNVIIIKSINLNMFLLFLNKILFGNFTIVDS